MNDHAIVDRAVGRHDGRFRCDRMAVRSLDFNPVAAFNCDDACARKNLAAGIDERSRDAFEKL